MNILITNDDGIDSPGLHELARAISPLGNITVCAPDREYSGSSVSIGDIHRLRPTLRRAVIDGVSEVWSVDGPPALCVMLALANMFNKRFDLVVSGINPGANTGRNVYHSGTIGATIVGRSYGVCGIAISQASPGTSLLGQTPVGDVAGQMWSTAAHIAREVVRDFLVNKTNKPVVLNVNVPNRTIDDLKGVRRTRIARESHRDGTDIKLIAHDDLPDAYHAHFSWGSNVDMPDDTDVGAVRRGLVSISPIGYLCAGDMDASPEHERSLCDRVVASLSITS